MIKRVTDTLQDVITDAEMENVATNLADVYEAHTGTEPTDDQLARYITRLNLAVMYNAYFHVSDSGDHLVTIISHDFDGQEGFERAYAAAVEILQNSYLAQSA